MDRNYLFVTPEEYAEVQASGALWDDQSKRWYISGGMAARPFSQWLDEQDETEFGISCNQALEVSAHVACLLCQQPIEVITVFCELGIDSETGDAIADVTLSSTWAMNEPMAAQLEP